MEVVIAVATAKHGPCETKLAVDHNGTFLWGTRDVGRMRHSSFHEVSWIFGDARCQCVVQGIFTHSTPVHVEALNGTSLYQLPLWRTCHSLAVVYQMIVVSWQCLIQCVSQKWQVLLCSGEGNKHDGALLGNQNRHHREARRKVASCPATRAEFAACT